MLIKYVRIIYVTFYPLYASCTSKILTITCRKTINMMMMMKTYHHLVTRPQICLYAEAISGSSFYTTLLHVIY